VVTATALKREATSVRTVRGALRSAFPWAVGIGAGLAVLGPALRGGSLLSLDLVVTPRIPMPRGVWGLGPELPRRVPLTAALAWMSTVIGGPTAWKLAAVAAVAGACAGAWRLAAGAPRICRLGAGLLYALSPFTLTRLGVGHLGLVVAMAMLPWALPTLLQPSRDPGRTFLWSAALGCAGVFGGLLALPVVIVGLGASGGRRALLVLGAFVVAQLPWLVPGAIVLAQSGRVADASFFATEAHGVGGVLRVLAGRGFWQPDLEVGNGTGGTVIALLGIALCVLAVVGARDLPPAWRGPAAWAAAVGVALTLASAMPVVRDGYEAVTATPLGAPLREGQRFLALYLVWMAPAAAFGAARIARLRPGMFEGLLRTLPLAIALVLAGPGLLGIDGRLAPVSFPSEWSRARAAVTRHPGTTLALPWHQYMQLQLARGRNVFNPVPIYFGGDVLSSSDPGFVSQPEHADPREPAVRKILHRIRAGDRASRDLARLGVRWIVVLHEVDWQDYRGIARDPGLERTVSGSTLDLWRVRAWRGPVLDDTGGTVSLRSVTEPFGDLDASGAATWFRPAAYGWMRGWEPAHATRGGLLRLPAGTGPVWYWPTVVVLAGDALTMAAVGWLLARRRWKHASDLNGAPSIAPPVLVLPDRQGPE
jgi:hypothetical protein